MSSVICFNLRRKATFDAETTIMALMRLGPQVNKKASLFIRNGHWVLTEMCIVNVSPMNARQMMYIIVAQVQTVVDFHTLQCSKILATCRLEIFTFLIWGQHRCLLQFELVDNKLEQRVADKLCLLNRSCVQQSWMGLSW